jgi:hypothetical protein
VCAAIAVYLPLRANKDASSKSGCGFAGRLASRLRALSRWPGARAVKTMNGDTPLALDWHCEPCLIEKLGLRPKNARELDALTGVIGALLTAAEAGRWVSYSRNRNRYSGKQRYQGPSFTYRLIIPVVDELARIDLIEHRKARPTSHGGWQSRMRASPALTEAAGDGVLQHHVCELLRLKDGTQLIPYADTSQTIRWRRELEEVNAALHNIEIELPGIPRTARHFLLGDSPILITPKPGIYRVFVRGSWQCGGRCFAWWQSCPGTVRDNFRLNGEAVARPDYCALHAQLLYARHGVAMDGDVYDVGAGFARDQGKLAFQVALNARDRRTAIGAIAKNANLEWPRAKALLDAVKSRNAPIADAFGTDIGVKLMRLDSEIILDCLKACISKAIPVLPVHDELIVPARASRAAEIMVESFETRASPVTPCKVRLK